MGFHDVLFPLNVDYGTTGGPAFDVDLTTIAIGHREAVLRSPDAPRTFNAAYGVRSLADVRTVLAFFLARQGATHTFRYRDWMDYSSAADHVGVPSSIDQVLGAGDDTTTQFQLRKTYSSGGFSHEREVTKPQLGSVVVSLDSVDQSSGWSVNTVTGLVTFSTAPTAGVIVRAGFEFDCEVRFASDAGQALIASIEHFDDGGVRDVELSEELSETLFRGFEDYGGATNWGAITEDQTIVPVQGRVQVFAPTTTGHALILPPTSLRLPLGAVYFWLVNDGSESLDLQNADGSSLHTIADGTTVSVALSATGTGIPVWIAWTV